MFTLGQRLLRCWDVVFDLHDLIDDAKEAHISNEQIIASLEVFADLYQKRFKETWELYGEVEQAYSLPKPNKNGKKRAKKGQKVVDQ